ncbi:MAG TPA: NEAT domain-containing protein [Candidatus Alectryocaccobium stercorigallinarum]|nr:NEAT domain-containing protein [Candidatus Alectryocaccobium stercorigallinarum]
MKNKLVIRLMTAALAVGMIAPQTAMTVFGAESGAEAYEALAALDPAQLADGEYSVNISLMNATNPGNASMANNAVEQTAALFVRGGSYYLQVGFKGMSVGNMTGYLKSLSYWNGSSYQEASVLSSYEDVVDDYNDENKDGTADYLYPQLLEMPLLNKNAGDNDGYVQCQVYVPLMGSLGVGTQDVLLLVDWDTLAAVDVQEPEPTPEPGEETPAGTQVSSVEAYTPWGDGAGGAQFPDISKYAEGEADVNYANAVNKVTVNGTEYSNYYDVFEDDAKIPFSWEISAYGLRIYDGAVKEGENTVVVQAGGYMDKTIVFTKSGDTYTFVSQTDGAAQPGDTVDTAALTEKILEAGALTQGDRTDEAWTALQDAIAAAKAAAGSAESQTAVDQALAVLTEAVNTFLSSASEPGGDVTDLEDGEYTLSFVANQEGKDESSMLQGAFDPRVKLTVENGEMKISMMNTALVWALIDFSIESNGEYPESEQRFVGKADASGNYSLQEFTMPVSDLSVMHKGAVLVTAMGGQISDEGNYEKYTKLDITFGTDIQKGWEGYQYEIDNPEGEDGTAQLIKVLCDKGYDLNDDGEMSVDEIRAIEGPLDLSYQNLTDISLLTNLSDKVTSIDLTGNKIETLPEGMLDNLVNLETFYASSNLIGAIPEGFFKNNSKLTWVNMSSNLIASLDAGDLTGLTAVTELDFGNNAIRTVDANAFQGLAAVTSLALNGNQLTELPDNVFSGLDSVTFLNLDENKLVRLPSSIGNMASLSWLTAARNQLAVVSGVDFSGLGALSQVDFSSNQISELQPGTFSANTELSVLKLYNNCLTGFTADILPEDIKLQTLDLQMNQLAGVDDEVRALTGDSKIYPQLSDLGLVLKETEGALEWSQNMTVLELQYWYDATSSYISDEITSADEFYAMLEQKGYSGEDFAAFLDKEGYDWQIWTEVQRLDENGNYVTVSQSYENDKADSKTGSFTPVEAGTYRVAKTLYASTYGSLDYKFTAVSNDVTAGGQDVSIDDEKQALKNAIDAAKAVKQGNKTETAWLILQNAINLAEHYLETSTDAQELKNAAADLQEAVEMFNMSADIEPEKTDKSGLQSALKEAEECLKDDSYTDEELAALQALYDTAKEVYDSEDTTQEQIDAQTKLLSDAVQNLKDSAQKPDEPGDTELDIFNLKDGVYSVTGNMVKVDKETASMSDNAINHTIKLTVKDGKYYITLDFKGLEIGSAYGYLSTLKYFLAGYTTDQYGNPAGDTADVTVDSYQTDENGNRVSDSFGTDYPDMVTFELIPEALKDGYVPLQVFVPIMESIAAGTGTQNVFLKLDWSSIKAASAEDPGFTGDGNGDNNGGGNNNNDNNGGNSNGGSNLTGGSSLTGGSNLTGGSSLGGGANLNGGTKLNSNVNTGDTADTAVYAVMITMAGAAAAAAVVKRKREKDEER